MAIQMEKAQLISDRTTQKFKDNCNHQFEKEYFRSTATGDDACSICGETRVRK